MLKRFLKYCIIPEVLAKNHEIVYALFGQKC